MTNFAARDWDDTPQVSLVGAPDEDDAERMVTGLLRFVGDDPDREGLLRTPRRVVESLRFLTSGCSEDLEAIVNGAVFAEECSEMVVVKDVEFYSLCEHHLLPFHGQAHIAYIPDGRVIGLSKLARIVDLYARRLQVQERMTEQIADAIVEVLRPLGAGVVVQASHLCMMMRGVQKQNSRTVTSSMRGQLLTDATSRAEFLGLVHGRPH